jgi:hypothetical protein
MDSAEGVISKSLRRLGLAGGGVSWAEKRVPMYTIPII